VSNVFAIARTPLFGFDDCCWMRVSRVGDCLGTRLVEGVGGCAFFSDTDSVLMFLYVTTILDGDGLGDHWCVVATCPHFG
jgi:hypothetical protein